MPTFNEQRGQGTFQPVLSDPTGVGPGGRTIPGPALGAAAGGIKGAASVFDVLASRPLPPNQESEDLIANKADLEAELIGEVSLIADAPIPSGIFRQAKDDIDRAASAYRQGRMSQTEVNVRLASIVQRYVSTDPRNSKKYRDLARDVLGILPTEELLSERIADIEFSRDQQREITRDEADFAVSKGVIVADANGGIDVESTALKGRRLRQLEAEQDALKDKLALQKQLLELENGRKPTQREIDDSEYRTFTATLNPLLDERIAGLYQSILAFKRGPASSGMSREEQITQLSNNVNTLRAEVSAIVGQAALSSGISPTTRQNALNAYMSDFDAVEALFIGDLSEFANTERLLSAMGDKEGLHIAKTAPLLTTYKALAGEEYVTDVVRETVQSSPELRSTVTEEAFRLSSALLQPGADIMSGQRGITDMSQTEKVSAAKTSMRLINQMGRTPQSLNDNQKLAYKNANMEMIIAATETDNVRDRARGIEQLSSARNINAIKTLAANDPEVAEIGAGLRTANAQVFAETARRLQPDTTANQLIRGFANPLLGADTRAKQFVPVYNPETRMIEIQSGRDGNFSTPEERLPPFLVRSVEQANKNLNAIIDLRQVGDDEFQGTDDEVRLAIVQSTGTIRVIGEE